MYENKSDFIKHLRRSLDLDFIDDIILNIADNPSPDVIDLILSIFNELSYDEISIFLLNLIFVIGEVGKSTEIPEEILHKLNEVYFKSDRWIRAEVVEALGKISMIRELKEKDLDVIFISLSDEYEGLQIKALEILIKKPEYVSNKNADRLITLLKSSNSIISDKAYKILKSIIHSESELITVINDSKVKLSKKILRKLITLFSSSIRNLIDLKFTIVNSAITSELKDLIFSEIETLIKIMRS